MLSLFLLSRSRIFKNKFCLIHFISKPINSTDFLNSHNTQGIYGHIFSYGH